MIREKWFRTYFTIWVGQFVSMLTSYAVNFAVIIWLSLEMQSAEVLAYAGIAGLLPQALIGPFAGVFIDRLNRKKVMIYSDLFIAFSTFLMILVLKQGYQDLILIYILLGLRSIGSAFHSPAMQAITPLIVPEDDLLRVAGINQLLQSVSSIAGPALGALAITYLPISEVLYLDIIGAAGAIISLSLVIIPSLPSQGKGSFFTVINDLKDGLNAIQENTGLKYLFMYSMMATFFIMPVAVMFPLLTTGHYGGDKFEMSVIEVIWGIGMLIGGSILGGIRISISKVALVNAAHLLIGLTIAVSGIFPSSWFWVFVAVTGLGGLSMSVFSATFMTIIQQQVKPEYLGRVFSLYFSIAVLPSIIGLLFTGYVAEWIGVASAFIIAGILIMMVGVASFLTPPLMRLGKTKKAAEELVPNA